MQVLWAAKSLVSLLATFLKRRVCGLLKNRNLRVNVCFGSFFEPVRNKILEILDLLISTELFALGNIGCDILQTAVTYGLCLAVLLLCALD